MRGPERKSSGPAHCAGGDNFRREKKAIMTMKRTSSIRRFCLTILGFLAVNAISFAQQNTSPSKPSPTGPLQVKTGPAPSLVGPDSVPGKPVAQSISAGQAVYLVRSTLMTLNDANRTGNYSVLRDLAAPAFQARNSAADLAQSFLDLRRRKFDLFAVSFADPEFNAPLDRDPGGKIRLTGFFPTQPLQIRFDLTFQSVDGQWKLLSISVATPEAPKEQSSLSRPSASRHLPDGFFYGVRWLSATGGWRW